MRNGKIEHWNGIKQHSISLGLNKLCYSKFKEKRKKFKQDNF